jgi:geranylgeranyl transferase type-2 subunit beta
MSTPSYLQTLTQRLTDGLAALPAETRQRHVAYLLAAQQPDGGWSGREGESDLYYTAFALRGLAVLDALDGDPADRASAFLRGALGQQASVVDFFSLLYACVLLQTAGASDPLADAPPDWPERVAATLETLRTPDGGYNKTPGGNSGSTYHTFLVALCYEVLGRKLPNPAAVRDLILARRREDGGFVEVTAMRRSGTNPTAAAIGLLQLAAPETLDPEGELHRTATTFLAESIGEDGGLRANTRVPLSDLLSTFTGCWTLHQLGALDRVPARVLRKFVKETERAEGGFHAGFWDPGHDVEYTFYGLGVWGLIG